MGSTSFPPDAIIRINEQLAGLLSAMMKALPTAQPLAGGAWYDADLDKIRFAQPTLPVFTLQPASQTVSPGDTATFTITATSAETYQWQVNSGAGYANITGATSTSYTTGVLSLSDDGLLLRCIATGPGGSTTSNAATLGVVNAFYVNSVTGDDSGDGRTTATAKKTLAAAQASVVAGDTLYLAKGSNWREQFDFPVNDLTISTYGSGAAPIIDGANAITGTWTQPDAATYPDVWSVSWTRAQAATTGSAHVAVWIDGVLPSRYAETLADLQTNGGYNADTLLSTTTTLSIKSATNPNSDGKLYEASFRRYGINGHSQTLSGGVRAGQTVSGPIEIKRAIDHYNGHAGGQGTTARLLILDGNIHHTVTQGTLTEDSIYTGATPSISASAAVAYTAISPESFEHVFRRCMAFFAGGTDRRINSSGFYAHGSATIAKLTVEQTITRAAKLGSADAVAVVVQDCYTEEGLLGHTQAALTNVTFDIRRVICRDLTTIADSAGNTVFRRTAGSTAITLANCGFWHQKGATVQLIGDTGTRPQITNCVLAGTTNSGAIAGGGHVGCSYSVLQQNGLSYSNSSILGDFNIYAWPGQNFVRASIGGTLYTTLGLWQAATGQDANSVYVRTGDQTSGNANALWLGVSEAANNGPADGDFRINPNARVYTGDETALIGTFADGTTPLTDAGIQQRWNFNARSIVSGPPTRPPVYPNSLSEYRSYVADPDNWDFYPE